MAARDWFEQDCHTESKVAYIYVVLFRFASSFVATVESWFVGGAPAPGIRRAILERCSSIPLPPPPIQEHAWRT